MPVLKKICVDTESDHAFMDAFCDAYTGFMYHIASKYTASHEDREDIVQEASIRLVKNVSALRRTPQEKILKYITLTVRATYLDMQKHKWNLVIPVDDQALEELLCEVLLEEKTFAEVSAKLDVERLKNELPTKDWILLEGKYLLDLTWEELGALVGVNPASVRMMLSRARKTAEKILMKPVHKGGRKHE